jgi:hypothetical protein
VFAQQKQTITIANSEPIRSAFKQLPDKEDKEAQQLEKLTRLQSFSHPSVAPSEGLR